MLVGSRPKINQVLLAFIAEPLMEQREEKFFPVYFTYFRTLPTMKRLVETVRSCTLGRVLSRQHLINPKLNPWNIVSQQLIKSKLNPWIIVSQQNFLTSVLIQTNYFYYPLPPVKVPVTNPSLLFWKNFDFS